MSREVCMDKGTCKSQTAGSPGSTKMPAKKECMGNIDNCALLVLEDSVSTDWVCHWLAYWLIVGETALGISSGCIAFLPVQPPANLFNLTGLGSRIQQGS